MKVLLEDCCVRVDCLVCHPENRIILHHSYPERNYMTVTFKSMSLIVYKVWEILLLLVLTL
jgi:hypothetical protein